MNGLIKNGASIQIAFYEKERKEKFAKRLGFYTLYDKWPLECAIFLQSNKVLGIQFVPMRDAHFIVF